MSIKDIFFPIYTTGKTAEIECPFIQYTELFPLIVINWQSYRFLIRLILNFLFMDDFNHEVHKEQFIS